MGIDRITTITRCNNDILKVKIKKIYLDNRSFCKK